MRKALSRKQIDNRILKKEELKRRAAELVAQADAIDTELKEEMTRQGVTVLIGDTMRARWNEIEKKQFDRAAFCADPARKALYESYKVPVKSRPFYTEKRPESEIREEQKARALASAAPVLVPAPETLTA